jgi:hypothetical protein
VAAGLVNQVAERRTMGGMTITSDTHSTTLSGEEWLCAQATRGWEKAGLSQLDE